MDRKTLLFLLNGAISAILIAAILWYVGAAEVAAEIGGLDLWLLLASIACLFAMDLLMSFRILIILRELGVRLPFIRILSAHFIGMLLADFTPSRTGYFATAASLHYHHGVPSEKALLSIFGPQIFDFAFKLVAGSGAVVYLMAILAGPGQGWFLLAGSLAIGAIIAIMLLTLFSRRFLGSLSFLRGIPVASGLHAMAGRMQEGSHVIVRKAPHIVALILASWTFRALSWYFAAKAVGITLDTPYPEAAFYFFLQPLVTMLEFVPSPTIAGLGLSEGGSTLVFSLFGIGAAKAAAFALVVRFKTTLLHLPAVPAALRTPANGGGGRSSEPDQEGGPV